MAAISTSVSPPRGSTNRFGSRLPITSISGSTGQRLVHHDPRPAGGWRRSRWSRTRRESPSPEWMLSTTKRHPSPPERPRCARTRGSSTRTRATRSAVRATGADEPAQNRVVRDRDARRVHPRPRAPSPAGDRRDVAGSRTQSASVSARIGRRPPNSGERIAAPRPARERRRSARARRPSISGAIKTRRTTGARSETVLCRYATEAACARSMLSPGAPRRGSAAPTGRCTSAARAGRSA